MILSPEPGTAPAERLSPPCGPRPILEVARDLGIDRRHVIPYGDDKAKIRLEARATDRAQGKLVLVSAITPTGAGEGKTTSSIGLAQGLARIGESVCLALREPSLGPTFGMKGGATGGGRSVVVPAEDINLHFTGDFHAVTTAHNLLAALLDNHIHHGNAMGIDPRRVLWRRVLDVSDRALRNIVCGLGGALDGMPRESGFDITAASEIMATLCLAEDAQDLRVRLSRLLVALTFQKEPVTAGGLQAVGPLMVVLKDALLPNLVQTAEGVPAFIHGGPFANIAHGCNSVIATKMALAHADWVVTEAGFGFDLGAEKFYDIKCRKAGLDTAAVVLVATVRALKRHGGTANDQLAKPDPAAVERGLGNLRKHVENVRLFGEPPVVSLNRFAADSADEIETVRRACADLGVAFAVLDGFTRGGEGAVELARTVVENAEPVSRPFLPLYDWSEPIPAKMEKIARQMYGAGEVAYTAEAERDLKLIRKLGYEGLPLCVAKTPMSLSDDPSVVGRPEGFRITVRRLILATGAGFVVPLLGDILRMPGLPASPQAFRMDLVDGHVTGMLGVKRLAALLAFLSLGATAAPPRVETAGPPPQKLAAALRAELVAEGARAATANGGLEVWMRKEPALGKASEGLGISFGRLTPGALAGAVRLSADWTDYKGQRIRAGLYTLRYAIEPTDGYHLGASAYRDFFLLIPAADDPGPARTLAPQDLYALSNKASRSSHPAVVALFPVPAAEKAGAAVNEIGQPALAIPYGGLTLGIVVEGTGEI